MSEQRSENKGFLFFDDWEKPFRKLPGEEFKALFWAMFDFQKNGDEPPEFEGSTALIADFVFPQLSRRMKNQIVGRQNVEKRWKKEETPHPDSLLIAPYKRANSTLIHKDIDKDKDIDIDKDIDNTPKPPKGAEVYSERFCIFWKEYPKKVGKTAAEKAFLKLKPSEEMLQQMLDTIKAQKQTEQWMRDNGQYIPNPSTWLNRGQWEDEITAPQSQKADMSLDEFFS